MRTAAELAAVVGKTMEYEGVAAERTAVLAADGIDLAGGFSFSAASDAMAALLPTEWQVEKAYVDDLGLDGARELLLQRLNEGVSLTSYFGHSGLHVWSFQGLFSTVDAKVMENAGRPTLVTQWGCWNTYYVDEDENTMGHEFLLNGDQGAAAVLGASTLTDATHERELARHLYDRLFQPGLSLGDAVRLAKQVYAADHPDHLDVLLGWTLLGDPGIVMEPR